MEIGQSRALGLRGVTRCSKFYSLGLLSSSPAKSSGNMRHLDDGARGSLCYVPPFAEGLKGYACFGCIYRKVCMTGEIKVEETVVECECKEDPICDELNGVEGLRVEDILQMEFSNPKEVRCFYNNYSRLKGFVMGQGKKIPNNVGEIVRYTIM
ncbi:hypothetical protein AHAS_Ahas01G0159300 [Arachis hypogaea]